MAKNDVRQREVLSRFSKSLLSQYKDNLRGYGAKTTGSLINTAKQRTTVEHIGSDKVFRVYFTLEDYWQHIENGRLSGSWPPPEAMLSFVRNKPIIPQPATLPNGRTYLPTEEQLAFLIGRKIYQDGIAPKPALLEAENLLFEPFISELNEARKEDLMETLKEELK